jgi:hypothetical protein
VREEEKSDTYYIKELYGNIFCKKDNDVKIKFGLPD